MIYSYTSIREVIGRVIRNTRLQDTTYIVDMNEWIPEAMGIMKTRLALETKWKDIEINFHSGKLPCGLEHIKAVEYNGRRLVQFKGSTDIDLARQRLPYKTYEQQRSVTVTNHGPQVYQSTTVSVDQCMCLPAMEGEYYDVEAGQIRTSMCDAVVRIHYATIPLDDDGLPLIPDNENYKQALYWYCRWMMIGAGYEDKVYNVQYCEKQFDIFAPRAIGEIIYPDTNEMEGKVARMNRLVKIPGDFFESFFGTKVGSNAELTTATSPMPISRTTILTSK